MPKLGSVLVTSVPILTAQEYANEAKLKELVQRYSEFINFPIMLQTEKEVEVPVEEEAEEEANEEEEEDEGG